MIAIKIRWLTAPAFVIAMFTACSALMHVGQIYWCWSSGCTVSARTMTATSLIEIVEKTVLAVAVEEVIFRWFVLRKILIERIGSRETLAVIASALLFAAYHIPLLIQLHVSTFAWGVYLSQLIALGVVLANVYVRSNVLLLPMVVHSLWNALTLVSSGPSAYSPTVWPLVHIHKPWVLIAIALVTGYLSLVSWRRLVFVPTSNLSLRESTRC